MIPGEVRRSRLRRAGYGFIGIFALLTVAAVALGVSQIEDGRLSAVQTELDRLGWTDIRVDFDGRDAVVSGAAPPGVNLGQVQETVSRVPGVRSVGGTVVMSDVAADATDERPPATSPTTDDSISRTEPDPVTHPGRIVLMQDGGLLVLRGTAAPELIDILSSSAGSVFGTDHVENRLEPGGSADIPEEWLAMVTTTSGILENYDGVTVRVNGARLEFDGTVPDESTGEDLARRFARIAGDVVEVSGSLEVVSTPAAQLVLNVSDGSVVAGGVVDSDATAAEVVERLEQVFGSAQSELATGAGRAPWAPRLPFEYLARGGSYTVTIDGETATLEGAVVSESVRNRLVGALRRSGLDIAGDLGTNATLAAGMCTHESLNTDPLSDLLFGPTGVDIEDSPRAAQAIADLAVRVGACDGTPLVLLVHTDGRLGHDDDHELSHERGGALLEALSTYGIDPKSISIIGIGADAPIAANGTEEGRAQNRRVEFQVMAGGG